MLFGYKTASGQIFPMIGYLGRRFPATRNANGNQSPNWRASRAGETLFFYVFKFLRQVHLDQHPQAQPPWHHFVFEEIAIWANESEERSFMLDFYSYFEILRIQKKNVKNRWYSTRPEKPQLCLVKWPLAYSKTGEWIYYCCLFWDRSWSCIDFLFEMCLFGRPKLCVCALLGETQHAAVHAKRPLLK
jgi:hypothetical protein